MEQENSNPIDMTVTVTYTYNIHSFEALAKDIVEAIKLFSDLPGDLASRHFVNRLFCNVLSNVADKDKNVDNVAPAEETTADNVEEQDDDDPWYDYGDEN